MTATQNPSTKHDILQHLLKQGSLTAQELAESLQISPQAVRRHLKDLEDEQLVLHETAATRTGRPNHRYALSAEGRSQFPDRYDEFAVSLLDTLAETVGKEQMGSILRKQWERKALEYRDRLGSGSLQSRVAKLVEIRQTEGYMAEFHLVDDTNPDTLITHPVETNSPHPRSADAHGGSPISASPHSPAPRFILTEYNCAISHIAESYPSVCGHELEMFAVALPDCTVDRTHWLVNGEHRCGYLIQPK
jgi:DeoR family transcriptional regulator, suf operon transcriptional repressor